MIEHVPMPANASPLSAEQLATFEREGYLVLRSFLAEGLVARLEQEVDRWVDEGWRARSIECCTRGSLLPPEVMELELGEHGWLISHPPLMAILMQLMGPVFAFHHLHSSRHDAPYSGRPWHHDYEQSSQGQRSHLMIHALHCLNGLDGTLGDLLLLPGSHRKVAQKKALLACGTLPLPGAVVIDRLPPGSTVLMHSALFHARRALPGGERGVRYFIESAYCQGGVKWSASKPYWRLMLARASSLGLARFQWPELFSERHFDEYAFPESTPARHSA